MVKKSMTELRNEITARVMEQLEAMLDAADIGFYHTGDNLNTLTWLVDEVNGEEIWGSIKFTLHKPNFDIKEKIEDYEILMETRKKAAEEKARKQAANEKEKARKAAEREAKQLAAQRSKEEKKSQLGMDIDAE
jgi:tRNA uridine 5-carbamoylmethylation protein Kti12